MGVTALAPAPANQSPSARRRRGRTPAWGARDVTCREFADFVMDYFDGQLADATRARFEEHLTLCPDCVQYLRQYRDTVEAGHAAFDDEAPAVLPGDLVQAILLARSRV
jgi:anti-sigma factor RsiW